MRTEPYLQDPDVTLWQGDALEVLRTLPDESVHCIATSPPFYALRDYGTGTWEGGKKIRLCSNCGCEELFARGEDLKCERCGWIGSESQVVERECDHLAPLGGGFQNSTLEKQRDVAEAAERVVNDRRQQYRHICRKCGARRIDQQIGLESSPDEWAAALVAVFREARRVLRKDGTLWVECGDSYSGAGYSNHNSDAVGAVRREDGGSQRHRTGTGLKQKDLIGSPFLLAFGLRDDGWWWRSTNIWAKPNCLPESVTDRPVVSHSYVFQFSKKARYFHDAEAVREPHTPGYEYNGRSGIAAEGYEGQVAGGIGRPRNAFVQHREYNPAGRSLRSVWTIPTQGFPEAHFATWPTKLAERILLMACPESVCRVCGKARERVVEVDTTLAESRRGTDEYQSGGTARGATWAGTTPGVSKKATTLGFTDCGHSDYRPGIVLDPFAGACTTLVVARRLRRHSVGIDLSADYLALGAKRLATWWKSPPQSKRVEIEGQESLFAVEA